MRSVGGGGGQDMQSLVHLFLLTSLFDINPFQSLKALIFKTDNLPTWLWAQLCSDRSVQLGICLPQTRSFPALAVWLNCLAVTRSDAGKGSAQRQVYAGSQTGDYLACRGPYSLTAREVCPTRLAP